MDKTVLLYTTHCPRCEVLTEKLEMKKIPYSEVTEEAFMTELGITSVPTIEFVNGQRLNFKEAICWLNSLDQEEN